jgi:3-methyladenine DNA glycosylase AlkD
MTEQEAMCAMEAQGTEQTRKTYRRHGVPDPLFGVSYAALEALRKKIKKDHALAQALWKTGNHDARVLATMIADPQAVEEALLDGWAADLDCYAIADAFRDMAAKTRFVRQKAEVWMESEEEWIGRVGWLLLAALAMQEDTLPDSYFESHLETIQHDIHTRKNRVRDAMNSAVIAIGIRNPTLERKALTVAAAIGKVEVDHGKTDCKTPDAAAYIQKAWERKRQKARKAETM